MAADSLRHAVPLQDLNSFGLPGRAARYLRLCDAAQLAAPMARSDWAATPRLVLGGGSNILLLGDFDGLVLHVALRGRRLLAQTDEAWLVEAAAGENWHDFVRWTLEQGWPGLENLSLIPGTVGAAPVQNIGAYGLELAERFESLEAVDLDSGERRCFGRADCAFAYRDSVFKQQPGRYLITRVVFRLPRPWQAVSRYAELARALPPAPTPLQVSDAVIAIRRAKLPDPTVLGNAGSFFKNPLVTAAQFAALQAAWPALPSYAQPDGRVKLAAGWLIEQCGWKGRSLGPAGVYERQALVLVNRGGARGADVQALALAIVADVRERFGVELEMEPVPVGRVAA